MLPFAACTVHVKRCLLDQDPYLVKISLHVYAKKSKIEAFVSDRIGSCAAMFATVDTIHRPGVGCAQEPCPNFLPLLPQHDMHVYGQEYGGHKPQNCHN